MNFRDPHERNKLIHPPPKVGQSNRGVNIFILKMSWNCLKAKIWADNCGHPHPQRGEVWPSLRFFEMFPNKVPIFLLENSCWPCMRWPLHLCCPLLSPVSYRVWTGFWWEKRVFWKTIWWGSSKEWDILSGYHSYRTSVRRSEQRSNVESQQPSTSGHFIVCKIRIWNKVREGFVEKNCELKIREVFKKKEKN